MKNEKLLHDYKNTLNIGEYGEYFLDYDIREYIDDIVTYIADANIDIYDYKIWEWAKNNQDSIESAIEQGYYNIDSREFDLIKLFQAGQYLYITDDLYNNLDDILSYVVIDYLQDDYINIERLIQIVDDTCYNVDNNNTIEHYIDIVRDEMEDYPMLEIHLSTGLAWTKSIIVEGTAYDDIAGLVDDYYLEHGDLPVPIYELDELIKGRTFKTQEEEWEYLDYLGVLPINGGEYYIDGISHIEEVI